MSKEESDRKDNIEKSVEGPKTLGAVAPSKNPRDGIKGEAYNNLELKPLTIIPGFTETATPAQPTQESQQPVSNSQAGKNSEK